VAHDLVQRRQALHQPRIGIEGGQRKLAEVDAPMQVFEQ
jgi:hypothetical protein